MDKKKVSLLLGSLSILLVLGVVVVSNNSSLFTGRFVPLQTRKKPFIASQLRTVGNQATRVPNFVNQPCRPSQIHVTPQDGWNRTTKDMVSFLVTAGGCELQINSFEVSGSIGSVRDRRPPTNLGRGRSEDISSLHGINIIDPWGFINSERFTPDHGTHCSSDPSIIPRANWTNSPFTYQFTAATPNAANNKIYPNTSKTITVRGGEGGGLQVRKFTQDTVQEGLLSSGLPIEFTLTKINGENLTTPANLKRSYWVYRYNGTFRDESDPQGLIDRLDNSCVAGTHGGHATPPPPPAPAPTSPPATPPMRCNYDQECPTGQTCSLHVHTYDSVRNLYPGNYCQ